MKKLALGLVAGLLVTTVAYAQDEAQDEAEKRPVERRHIQVLNDPHEIASFYRSSSSSLPYDYTYGGGFAAEPLTDRDTMTDRYAIAGAYRQGGGPSRHAIAGFYRQDGGYGRYARFWGGGASHRGGLATFHSRRIGPSELCLFAPTLLAPFAPFTGR